MARAVAPARSARALHFVRPIAEAATFDFSALFAKMAKAHQPPKITNFRMDTVRDFDRSVYSLGRSAAARAPVSFLSSYSSPLGSLDQRVGAAPSASFAQRLRNTALGTSRVGGWLRDKLPQSKPLPELKIDQRLDVDQARAARDAFAEVSSYARGLAFDSLDKKEQARLNKIFVDRAAAHWAGQGVAFKVRRDHDGLLMLEIDGNERANHDFSRFAARLARTQGGVKLVYHPFYGLLGGALAAHEALKNRVLLAHENVLSLDRSNLWLIHEVIHAHGLVEQRETPFDALAGRRRAKDDQRLPSSFKLEKSMLHLEHGAYSRAASADELRTFSHGLRVALRRYRRQLEADGQAEMPSDLVLFSTHLLDVGLRWEAIAQQVQQKLGSSEGKLFYAGRNATIDIKDEKRRYRVSLTLPEAQVGDEKALRRKLSWIEKNARFHGDQAIVLLKALRLLAGAEGAGLRRRLVDGMIAVIGGKTRRIVSDQTAKVPSFEALVAHFNATTGLPQ